MSRWIDRLPLLINARERCVALDSQGNRCKRVADIEDSYHGDHEIYHDYETDVKWVRVAFCSEHFKNHDPAGYKALKGKK